MFCTGTRAPLPHPILSEQEAALLDLRIGLGLDGELPLSRVPSLEADPRDPPSGRGNGNQDGAFHWEDWLTLASFSHPHVMSRLERLMGTNVVRITDRKYMLELQRRIREDHVKSVRERIKAREADELEREKKLILDGKMSLDEAPKELLDHPVFRISQIVKEFLEKGKVAPDVSQTTTASRGASHTWTTSDDGLGDRGSVTPTTTAAAASPRTDLKSPGSLSPRIETPREEESPHEGSPREGSPKEQLSPRDDGSPVREGSPLKAGSRKESHASAASLRAVEEERVPSPTASEPDVALAEDIFPPGCEEDEDFDPMQDIEKGYMLNQDDFDKLKYETESVKKMWELETVEELYELAEEIVREIVAFKVPSSNGGGSGAPA